ncbi:MAG: galactokinase [Bernardetiaceae bacterium]|jgi:galactokinase|nr:galactokinase [Bernardetiaceae bacterium]
MMSFVEAVHASFKHLYGHEPALYRAPGRINFIGEHTDYNQGWVLPAAVSAQTVYAIGPSPDARCHLHSVNFNADYSFDLAQITPAEKPHRWANYLLGVVQQMQRLGLAVPPFAVAFGGDVPSGSGMSSSAAVECGLAVGLNHRFGLGLEKLALAQLCQRAENEFVGIKCGIMDQFASIFGRAGHLIQLDCRDLSYQYAPLALGDYELLLCNTGVHHSLASSEYNTRRQQCETGVAALQRHQPQVRSLRDVSAGMLAEYGGQLDPLVRRRCQYVVEENARVEQVCQLLAQGRLAEAGALLYASHEGLQKKYEVSCPELDWLVAAARAEPAILGARMMGGGFGGCTLNLIRREATEAFVAKITPLYQQHTKLALKTYRATLADGAGPLPAASLANG